MLYSNTRGPLFKLAIVAGIPYINPKRAGLFCLSQVRGGGADSAPPSDLGRGAMKNSEIWHVRRVSQYERADEIAILKIKAFLNYANLC